MSLHLFMGKEPPWAHPPEPRQGQADPTPHHAREDSLPMPGTTEGAGEQRSLRLSQAKFGFHPLSKSLSLQLLEIR